MRRLRRGARVGIPYGPSDFRRAQPGTHAIFSQFISIVRQPDPRLKCSAARVAKVSAGKRCITQFGRCGCRSSLAIMPPSPAIPLPTKISAFRARTGCTCATCRLCRGVRPRTLFGRWLHLRSDSGDTLVDDCTRLFSGRCRSFKSSAYVGSNPTTVWSAAVRCRAQPFDDGVGAPPQRKQSAARICRYSSWRSRTAIREVWDRDGGERFTQPLADWVATDSADIGVYGRHRGHFEMMGFSSGVASSRNRTPGTGRVAVTIS
jgi:hypothetical protein